MLRLTTLVFLATLSINASAWFDTGHEVIGEIAWSQLDTETRESVTVLLKQLEPIYEEASSLATVSKLADNIKSGLRAFDSWHYIDLPYLIFDGGAAPTTKEQNKEQNVVWALCEGVRTLRSEQQNPQFQPKPFEKALMLAFLAHFVGDIHQPLHTITRYTLTQPEGDNGGVLFLIRLKDKTTNLHLFWDSGLGLFNNPLEKWTPSAKKSDKTGSLAESIMHEFPPQHFKTRIEETVFREWALDSHESAKKVAYDIKEGSEPSKEYITKGQQLSKERVALAGYRLAYLLKRLLGKESASLSTGCLAER